MRFYIDLEMETRRLVHWGCGSKEDIDAASPVATQQRVLISATQYERLQRRIGSKQSPMPGGIFDTAELTQ